MTQITFKRPVPSASWMAYSFWLMEAQILAGMIASFEMWQEVENAWFYQGGA